MTRIGAGANTKTFSPILVGGDQFLLSQSIQPAKQVNINNATPVKSINAANPKPSVENTAFKPIGDLTTSIWVLGTLYVDPVNKPYSIIPPTSAQVNAIADVKKEVKKFAASLGHKDIVSVKITPRDARNVIILSNQESSRSLAPGSFAVDIEYDCKVYGVPFKAKSTVWATRGLYGRVGVPYGDTKDAANIFKKQKRPWTVQQILRTGVGELGIQMQMGVSLGGRSMDWSCLSLTSTIRGPSGKIVNDFDNTKKTGERYTKQRSRNFGKIGGKIGLGISFDLSIKMNAGPISVGPYFELGRLGRDPQNPGKARKLWLLDLANITVNPALLKKASTVIHPDVLMVGENLIKLKTQQMAATSTVKLGAKALPVIGKIGQGALTKIGEKTAGHIVKKAFVGLAVGATKFAGPIGLAISGLMLVNDFIEWKKEKYENHISKLVDAKIYNPDYAISHMIHYAKVYENYFIGRQGRVLSAVIDRAIIEGKVDPIKLRQQWNKKLEYVGKTPAETQAARILAAIVLGRIDVIDKNIDRKFHTPTSLSSLEATQHHNQMVASLGSDLNGSKSEKLIQATPNTKGFRSFSMNILEGHLSATPSQIDENGNSKWLLTFKTQDGLSLTFYKTFDKQISVSDFTKNSTLYKTFANSINTQRAKFTKTPSYIKPWQGTLYGNPVTAIPLYMKKDGSIMWKVTATSNGKTVTIYESLGLDNQTGYQFDSSDLQDGHIFKIRLDNIISGREKQ
jgi:hypothetical protein